MTDRYDYLTVALDKNIRSDDAQPLIEAIKMLRGVVAVAAHVSDGSEWTADMRLRAELAAKLHKLVYPD